MKPLLYVALLPFILYGGYAYDNIKFFDHGKVYIHAQTDSSDNLITVKSINIHGLMPAIALDFPGERLPAIANALSIPYDQSGKQFATLQENWCRNQEFETSLRSRFNVYHAASHKRTSAFYWISWLTNFSLFEYVGLGCRFNSSSGLTLLSDHPLTEIEEHPFPLGFDACMGSDCLVEKGIICSWSENEQLRICTTHLQSSKNHANVERFKQLSVVNAVLRQFVGERLVVTGDFNICFEDLAERSELDQSFFASVIESHKLKGAFENVPYEEHKDNPCRKDFILYRGLRLQSARYISDKLSDHPLLEARFFR